MKSISFLKNEKHLNTIYIDIILNGYHSQIPFII